MKNIATSAVIFLPCLTRTRRRFPANARSTSTVIHVTMVARATTTRNVAKEKIPSTVERNWRACAAHGEVGNQDIGAVNVDFRGSCLLLETQIEKMSPPHPVSLSYYLMCE
ncbi:hypothetical protein Dsin_007679 [Dipteronia sinensis]|uniref:Uncharacterized protein n=1 Tax=Dipteronia sinensis TaxID=43782 RepID=A0AAE0B1Z4_9ROSI|nr:hypothetical protein Dsin_007679 [Dipteronia sinensis]